MNSSGGRFYGYRLPGVRSGLRPLGGISPECSRATARTSSSMVKLGEAFTKAAQMTPKQARELAEQEMKIKRQMINSLQIPRFR